MQKSHKWIFTATVMSLSLAGVKADHFRWLGDSNTREPIYTVDWQNASLWTNLTKSVGNVCPGDEDTVEFLSCPPYSTGYDVTPPVSFKGTFIGERSLSYGRWFYPRINLQSSSAPLYKIDGRATFVANGSLSGCLSETFSGTIEIPDNVVFEVPSSVSKEVKFIGYGTVVPSDVKQLHQVAGMVGTIDLSRLSDLDLADLSPLVGHRLILPENAVFDTDGMFRRIVDIEDWNVPDCWMYGGAHREIEANGGKYKAYAHEPYVLDDGTLLMTDDLGQRNVAWFKKRKFGYDDIWKISFSYQATQPEDAHPKMELPIGTYARTALGQFFGMVVSASDEGIPVPEIGGNGSLMPAESYGMRFYSYGDKPNVGKVFNGTGANVSDSWANTMLTSRIGISQKSAPVNVDVSMYRGMMYVSFSQNGNSCSFTVDCSEMFKGDISRKYTIGFFANTETSSWQHTRVSNFKGWYLSADAGQWKEVEGCRITPSNWILNAYSDGMEEENKVAPADQILENGDFMFLMGKIKYLSSATCQTRLDPAKKHRIEFDLKWGGIANRGQAMNMGFVNTPSVVTNGAITLFNVNAKYSPALMCYHYFNDLIGFTKGGNVDNETRFPFEYAKSSGLRQNNHTVKFAIDYDGVDTLVGSFVSSTSVNFRVDISAKYAEGFSSRFPDGMYFHCGGANGSNPNWKCYLETVVSGFKVLEWNDSADAQKWKGSVQVPQNQSTCLALGDVGIESVQMEPNASLAIDAAHESACVSIDAVAVKSGASLSAGEGVAVSIGALDMSGESPYALTIGGNVTLAESATVTIPAAWKAFQEPLAIMSFSSGTSPKSPVVVLDNGKRLASRQVFVAGNEVRVNLHLGTCVVIR